MKKTISIIVILLMILLITFIPNVEATEDKTELQIVNQNSETKYLDNDQGYISKNIIDSNKDTGEVTIELKLSNTKKETEQNTDTEIFLVVDNSPSMDFVTSTGKTRKELVLNSATQLVTSIFEKSENVKIGLIDFHGSNWWNTGLNNAKIRQNPTNDKKAILNAIDLQLQRNTQSGTNIEAGLQMAQQNFSKEVSNKIIILLTDGLPNADMNGTENTDANDCTDKGNVQIGINTRNTLLNIKKAGIYTITLLTGMNESDGNTDKEGNKYTNKNTLEEQLKAAEDIFGTITNPTADKYYLVSNIDINKIITEDILKDITEKIQNPINKVKIVDYFPQDITQNFEFSYVEKPTNGTVSDKIDMEKNTIEWNMETLKGNEVATLKYKLKLKDMKNEELLEKVIATNEKVVLTYTDSENSEKEVVLESSPQIKLTKIVVKQIENNEDQKNKGKKNDQTISKDKALPNTGKIVLIWIIGVIAISAVVANIRYKRIYK